MITKEKALTLRHGHLLHHLKLKNADGSPLRARVNGAVKTWKTRPEDFRIPMKHGLRDCFYLTNENANEWEDPNDSQQTTCS